MGIERFALGDPAHVAAAVRALAPGAASVADTVAGIVADVRARGDAALSEYVERFDDVRGALRVGSDELRRALDDLDPDVRAGLEVAIANVHAVAIAGRDDEREVLLPAGQVIRLREVPVRRAAIYVPGGRAPYPSTVVMGVVTARAAGVEEVVVCAPGAHPVILAACALCGADAVFRMGGAHAVAALSYGTASVPRADVGIVGKDVLMEQRERQVFELLDLGYGGCTMVLATVAGEPDPAAEALRRLGVMRVATKYPRLAARWLEDTGRQAEIVEVKGSVELAPLTGLVEAIVDLTATGTTLRENGLVVREEIVTSTARLIANPVAHKLKAAAIDEVVEGLRGADGSRGVEGPRGD